MNEDLIEKWNSVVEPEDVVYHLGDFGFLNSKEYDEFLNRLNGRIVLFSGNHDKQNKIKGYLEMAMMEFGSKKVFAQHTPPQIIPECDFCICGHVHDKWKHKVYRKQPNIPIINVGVDVWNHQPVSTLSLLKYYNEILKEM